MNELIKPCPFCSNEANSLVKLGDTYHVHCRSCKALGPAKYDIEEAIAAWGITPLKLFAFTDFNRDYSAGLAVALAPDKGSAEELIKKTHGRADFGNGDYEVCGIDKPVAFTVSGGS